MQRLFSMFPTGGAGIALFGLRICAVGALLIASHPAVAITAPNVKDFLLLALAVMLLFGIFTPVSCALALLAQAETFGFTSSPGVFQTALNMLTTASLLLLGPGAYSIDARLFGRRRILPPTQ